MSNLFMRQTEVLTGGLSLSEPNYSIYFKVDFDYDINADKGQIEIKNLSNETMNSIRKGKNIILNAGYEGDTGTIFAGVIQTVKTTSEDGERTTTITALDANEQLLTANINKGYAKGTKASAIIRDALKDVGLEIGSFTLKKDITYLRGKTISGSLIHSLKNIVNDCHSKIYINKGIVTIIPQGTGKNIAFVLNSESGLIESPTRIDKKSTDTVIQSDWAVKCLLNHRIVTDSIFQIKSRTANGLYQVVKGYHKKTDTYDELVTYVEVISI
jgi:hypothetical protein